MPVQTDRVVRVDNHSHGLCIAFSSAENKANDPEEYVYEPLRWHQNADGSLKSDTLAPEQQAALLNILKNDNL